MDRDGTDRSVAVQAFHSLRHFVDFSLRGITGEERGHLRQTGDVCAMRHDILDQFLRETQTTANVTTAEPIQRGKTGFVSKEITCRRGGRTTVLCRYKDRARGGYSNRAIGTLIRIRVSFKI